MQGSFFLVVDFFDLLLVDWQQCSPDLFFGTTHLALEVAAAGATGGRRGGEGRELEEGNGTQGELNLGVTMNNVVEEEEGDATQISVDLVFVPIQGGRGRLRQSATACTHEYTRYRAVQRDLNKKMN